MAMFEGKRKRAEQFLREQIEGKEMALLDENLNAKLEKGDRLAMVLSALLVIVPVALIALVVLALAGYFFVVR